MTHFGKQTVVRGALIAAALALAACEGNGPSIPRLTGAKIAPALSVLALDYERTVFGPQTQVSGDVARAQRDTLVATPSGGRIRREALGPIPTEVKVDLTSISTQGTTVHMRGTLILRDLSFGTTLAKLENFSASGRFPPAAAGSFQGGLVFRGIEDEVLAWVSTLNCDTRARICGVDLMPDQPAAALDVEPVEPGADLALGQMVVNRPGGSLTKLVGGAIDPGQVIAASTPQAAAEPPAAGLSRIGSTVAALGLLSRSGFWLQTPLVSEEGPGEVRDPATGRRLAVTLVPKDGPAGGGSQMSLAALSELGLDATALVTLEVYR